MFCTEAEQGYNLFVTNAIINTIDIVSGLLPDKLKLLGVLLLFIY